MKMNRNHLIASKINKLISLCCLSLLTAGCASVASIAGDATHRFEMSGKQTIPRVYSGVATDISFLRGDAEDSGVCALDLPLSFTVDTVALPYTIPRQYKYGNLYDPKQSQQNH
jgi:uncharacterized protein YceK